MDRKKEQMGYKALNVIQYLALARVIDNKRGAKVLIDAATETLSKLVDVHSQEEGLISELEETDIDLEDEDDDIDVDDPTLELEDLEDDVTLGEADDDDDDDDEDEVPVDDDDEDDIVEIDDDDEEDVEEDDEDEKEKSFESEAKVTRRALAIANRLYSSGDAELKKVAGILAKRISEKKG